MSKSKERVRAHYWPTPSDAQVSPRGQGDRCADFLFGCLCGTTWDLLVHVIGVRPRQVALLPEGDAVGALVLAQLQVHRIDMPRQVAAGEAVRAGVRALGQLGLSK